jgi:hypothetical protein
MAKKNTRRDHEDTERTESWDSEASAEETRHGHRSDMDRGNSEQPMPPKSRQPRQTQKKK